jgi:molecular chaperone GrpE
MRRHARQRRPNSRCIQSRCQKPSVNISSDLSHCIERWFVERGYPQLSRRTRPRSRDMTLPTTGFVTCAGLRPSALGNRIAVLPARPVPRRRSARRSSAAQVVGLGAAPGSQQPFGQQQPTGPDDAAGDAGSPERDPHAAPASAAASAGDETTAEDILSSPAFLKKKLEVVLGELGESKAAAEAAEDALANEKEAFVRLAADFENYRRRTSKDLSAQNAKATSRVCKEILVVLDNFERAIAAVNLQTDRERSIHDSYLAINKQLLDALVKLNVTPVEAVGLVFDPEVHDGIQRAESNEYPDGVVCAQFQRGYVIGDMLIRPAMVAVSTGPGPDIPAGADSAIETDAADVGSSDESVTSD